MGTQKDKLHSPEVAEMTGDGEQLDADNGEELKTKHLPRLTQNVQGWPAVGTACEATSPLGPGH